jgi:hypothetical protein
LRSLFCLVPMIIGLVLLALSLLAPALAQPTQP